MNVYRRYAAAQLSLALVGHADPEARIMGQVAVQLYMSCFLNALTNKAQVDILRIAATTHGAGVA